MFLFIRFGSVYWGQNCKCFEVTVKRESSKSIGVCVTKQVN
jgi:hypothetical protein